MNESNPPRRTGRSVGALFAGFLVSAGLALGTDEILHLAAVYPPWGQVMSDPLFGLATVYRILYSVAASYVTARLAPDRPMGHALTGGAIGFGLSVLGAVLTWNRGLGPHWYPVAVAAMAMPCAWIGGKLRLMQLPVRRAFDRPPAET